MLIVLVLQKSAKISASNAFLCVYECKLTRTTNQILLAFILEKIKDKFAFKASLNFLNFSFRWRYEYIFMLIYMIIKW